MKNYELLTVFKPSLDAEELDKAVEKITEEIKSYQGSVESVDKIYVCIDCFTVKSSFILVKPEVFGDIVNKQTEIADSDAVKLISFTNKLLKIFFRRILHTESGSDAEVKINKIFFAHN